MGIDVLGTHDLRLALRLGYGVHCFPSSITARPCPRMQPGSRRVGQRDLDAGGWVLAELESLDPVGQVEEMSLDRRQIQPGLRQEAQGRRPYAGGADRTLDGQRFALDLAELDRNLAAN